jgi:hypothetical protein
MATGFGHQAWVGIGAESTFGTGVAATEFMEVLSIRHDPGQKAIQKPSLRGLTRKYYTQSKQSPTCGFKAQMGWEGFELLLVHALGSNVTTGAGTPWTHTMALANDLPTGLSVTINPDAAAIGGSSAIRYLGSQISKLTLTQAKEDFLTVDVDFLCQDLDLIALPSPSFPTFVGIDWEQMSTSASLWTNTALGLQSFELSIDNMLADDRYKLGQSKRIGFGRKGPREISCKVSGEFDALTAFNLYRNLTETGSSVASWSHTGSRALTLTMAGIMAESGAPQIDDAGPIMIEMDFVVRGSTPVANDELALVLTNTTATI